MKKHLKEWSEKLFLIVVFTVALGFIVGLSR